MKKNIIIKRIFQLITVLLFILMICISGILFFVLPKTGYSEIERRKLTSFPEFTFENLVSGEFTDDLTKYVSDNFAFRENLVELAFLLEDLRGLRLDGVKIYSDGENTSMSQKQMIDEPLKQIKKLNTGIETPLLGEEVKTLINFESVIENTELYKELTEADIKGEQRGALFMLGDTALEIFYGNSAAAKDYSNILNAFRLAVPSSTNVYCSLIPTHFEFGLPIKYKSQVGREQKPFIDEIYSNLDADIIKVDTYSNIAKSYFNKDYLYFRSDHHWTALGAYRAYEAFAKSASFTPTPLSEFETKRIDRFLGTFYSSTYDKNLSENPDYVEFYAPTIPYSVTNYRENGVDTYEGVLLYNSVSSDSAGYLVFMGGDIPLSVIETQNTTGRSILVFKESYGNAFVPFLVNNFDTIYVADIRTFPFNAVDFVTEKEISDVLFLNSIMTSCTPPRIQNYLDLMK